MTASAFRAVVVGDEALRSPAYDEETAKDQDRALWLDLGQRAIACVCDGTSSSWHAARAADIVTRFVGEHQGLWPNIDDPLDGFHIAVDRLVDTLLRYRNEAEHSPVEIANFETMSEGEVQLHEENIRNRRKLSYQTTLVAAELTRHKEIFRLRTFKVGDSEMLAFDPDGRVIATTADLHWDRSHPVRAKGATSNSMPIRRPVRFAHASVQTEVLPDALARHVPKTMTWILPLETRVVLTSDGLIDAFDGPLDLFRWFVEHEDSLQSVVTLNGIHDRLKSRRGDDDVSFVWISPTGAQTPTS